MRVPKAYPAYFGVYNQIGQVRDWLDTFTNLYPVGRNGMHRYNNQDHSMLAAKAAVECIVSGNADKSALGRSTSKRNTTRAPRETTSDVARHLLTYTAWA